MHHPVRPGIWWTSVEKDTLSAVCSPGTVWGTAGGRWALTPSTPALGAGSHVGASVLKLLPPGLLLWLLWQFRERSDARQWPAFPGQRALTLGGACAAAPSPRTSTDLRARATFVHEFWVGLDGCGLAAPLSPIV